MALFLKEERDRDFLKACQRISRTSKGASMSMSDIAREASKQPAPSLYISPKECSQIIYRIRRGRVCDRKNPTKQRLFNEIADKYAELRKMYPRLSVKKIAAMIIERPASSFFLSEGRAINLYYELIKKK